MLSFKAINSFLRNYITIQNRHANNPADCFTFDDLIKMDSPVSRVCAAVAYFTANPAQGINRSVGGSWEWSKTSVLCQHVLRD
jgi:hypothetical protein